LLIASGLSIVKRAFAILLLVALPLQWAWAAQSSGCESRGEAPALQVALQADELGPVGGESASHECCAHSETAEVPCGQDCAGCHGLGINALVDHPSTVGVIAGTPGTDRHSCRAPNHIPDKPLRPPPPSLA